MNNKRYDDFLYKISKLRDYLKNRNYSCIEINSQTNFSYITRGRGFIGLASNVACGSLFITLDNVYLVADNVEANRLFCEQLGSNNDVKVMEYPWDDTSKKGDIVLNITKGLKVADETILSNELFELRTVMTEYDIDDYRKLSKDTAKIVENICKNIKKGISEYQLAGEISKRLWSNNIEPITILIAFDNRALKYRHPVMKGNILSNYALVSVCGRRNGLIVSLSRDVLIDVDEEMLKKHVKCAKVDAAFTSSLEVGNSIENVFKKGIEEYKNQGYELEYKYHHQGGLTGYIPREIKANIGCNHKVRENEVYAFNPTIQGAKCEDTILVLKDKIEVLTYTGQYDYVECEIDGRKIIKPTVYVINK